MAGWTWDHVIPMPGRRAAAQDGHGAAALQQVRAYWEGLREAAAPPQRSAIDPRGMTQALEHVFLLERIAPGEARFRLAGMHLTALMGMEVRGMPLSALFDPAARAAARSLLDAVFRDHAVVELTLEAERGIGRPPLGARMLLLPVLGDDGICDRMLGCLVTSGDLGRSPRRFAIARSAVEPMRAVAAPPAAPRAPVAAVPSGLAEASRSFVSRSRPAKTAPPYLRLVTSDD